MNHKNCGKLGIVALVVGFVVVPKPLTGQQITEPDELSRYMNSISPSRDYFCVSNGASNFMLHPDRAPHTQTAQQAGVVLFSGAAPQLGTNFTLPAGALIYRNQMSTLGSWEPSPQVGTAGRLLDDGGEPTNPWTEARWHQGEDITWQGYRAGDDWIGGLPYWDIAVESLPDDLEVFCEEVYGVSRERVHEPELQTHVQGGTWGLHSSFNLQLARGIYQASKVRGDFERPHDGTRTDECPFGFREPWFQGRGRKPVFSVELQPPGFSEPFSIAKDHFPTYQNVYTFEELELDGGRLAVEFERSATWPRQPLADGGAKAGTMMASEIRDEYGNRVAFDRVPRYGYETDFKAPRYSTFHTLDEFARPGAPPPRDYYQPLENSHRLPHKRLRSVKLYPAGASEAAWTVAFVYEHPESDRISATDTLFVDPPQYEEWGSIYSHLPQSEWAFGRLPELNDQTTLLTVQAYKGDIVVNGGTFQDDYSVWSSSIGPETTLDKRRLNPGIERLGDANSDGEPGVRNVDDDGDGVVDEDCGFGQPLSDPICGSGDSDGDGWPDFNCKGVKQDAATGYLNPECFSSVQKANDDNEDGIVEYLNANDAQTTSTETWHGITSVHLVLGNLYTDPAGDKDGQTLNGLPCPGLCGVDDDGDGLIDEDSNGYVAYLAPNIPAGRTAVEACAECQNALICKNATGVPLPLHCLEIGKVRQSHRKFLDNDQEVLGGCPNPLYWRLSGPDATGWHEPPGGCEDGGNQCPSDHPLASDCCVEHAVEPACQAAPVPDCACDVAPCSLAVCNDGFNFCECGIEWDWDNDCVASANDRSDPGQPCCVCQQGATIESCGGNTGNCCDAQSTPGCCDAACRDAVANESGYEYCCSAIWDDGCAQKALELCGCQATPAPDDCMDFSEGRTILGRWDHFASYDDDEDGLVDEDGADDPLLVHLRASLDDCASGKLPFVPKDFSPGGGTWAADCRSPYGQSDSDQVDPWVYQVQYVYARSNPHWLLRGRNSFGRPISRPEPDYYYYPPFSEDVNGDGQCFREDINGGGCQDFPLDGEVHVHPDCVPDPDFRGPQGEDANGPADPARPSGIHLIKRIVRVRNDLENDPHNLDEKVWLYRYNDIGFLKAVFGPPAVQAIIDADPRISAPDDILKYADIEPIGEEGNAKPLILYASQWYTYYNPYDYSSDEPIGDCFDHTIQSASCGAGALPGNACDGAYDANDPGCIFVPEECEDYDKELHVDPDCSPFMSQTCGMCYARAACEENCSDTQCFCTGGFAAPHLQQTLLQMGISGARPRLRKYMVKTAMVAGSDGERHFYRFDYLGGSASPVEGDGRITSYADPHNITIVDELILADISGERNEFYIYSNDDQADGFDGRFVLDPSPQLYQQPPRTYEGTTFSASTHYLESDYYIKTRRVVVMNYYGIAISDRLILTPGFAGDQVSLIDDRYEMINTRGQMKLNYDQSWVATLRDAAGEGLELIGAGLQAVGNQGRVLAELFGGEGGWHSVLLGIAWGSGGGHLYNQQCRSEAQGDIDVIRDVPLQRVTQEQLRVVRVTQHADRTPLSGPHKDEIVKDKPSVQAAFYQETLANEIFMTDPAGTLGDAQCLPTPVLCGCNPGSPDCSPLGCETTFGCSYFGQDGDNSICLRYLTDVDLHNQDPVVIHSYPRSTATENDGVSEVHYHYVYWDQDGIRTKFQHMWSELVSLDYGGTGNTALQINYFDKQGRLQLSGQGSGEPGTDPPTPVEPFILTYYGYDEFGRQFITIQDFDLGLVSGLAEPRAQALGWPWDADGERAAPAPDFGFIASHEFKNLITRTTYDPAGIALRSVCQGFDADADFILQPGIDPDAQCMHYTTIRPTIHSRKEHDGSDLPNGDVIILWTDPYEYDFVYQAVGQDGKVYGTTTVTVKDPSGRVRETRTIARSSGSRQKVTDFGWAITVDQYAWNGALSSWDPFTDIPDSLAGYCGEDVTGNPIFGFDCDGLGELTLYPGLEPSYPVLPTDQIVTLARSYKRYEQASTLKPTADIFYSRFDNREVAEESRQMIRKYLYDLEERIARQKDPEGTVNRFIFDPKRRPTKVFKGSMDGGTDWFPRSPEFNGGCAEDDMVLAEHMLYNDGIQCREFNILPGEGAGDPNYDPCNASFVGWNDNFPNNATKLVRHRNYSDQSETCEVSILDPEVLDTASRDVQYLYDWRGRPVIVRQVTVGHNGGTSANPTLISATTTIYDNLDRPWLVAAWDDEDDMPTVLDTQRWSAADPNDPTTLAEILNWAVRPLSVSETIYDERGRVFEKRDYNVDPDLGPLGDTFTFTKSYHDDLDRVVAEVGPNGMTFNTYDSLNRVLQACQWSKDNVTAPGSDDGRFGQNTAEGTELTCIQYEYAAFGNVLRQIRYDRKDIDGGGQINVENAIVTFTYNWYDPAKRLVATANFGTAAADGYTNALAEDIPDYDPTCAPHWNGSSYVGQGFDDSSCTSSGPFDKALVSEFKYDAAGRRTLSRDPKGLVTRTEYDLLGRTLLQAENWREDPTTEGSGPIRYTAYHYTNGGLLDMIVSVVPDPDNDVATIGYGDILWDDAHHPEDNPNFAARTVTVTTMPDARIQATGFVYGGAVLPEVQPHPTSPISLYPSLISEIRYPDPLSGQVDPNDRLAFKYTVVGMVAQRTDQRGVRLDFYYGDNAGCGTCGANDQLTDVTVDYSQVSSFAPVSKAVEGLHFSYDASGRLQTATSDGTFDSTVKYTYNGFGNLIQERLHPFGGHTFFEAKSTEYDWSFDAANRNRLEKITYPSGRVFKFNYGSGNDAANLINRAEGIDELDPATGDVLRNMIAYEHTGSGRTVGQTWGTDTAGTDAITVDYTGTVDSDDPPGLDPFGRTWSMVFKLNGLGPSIHQYHYGYDANGNRAFAQIDQPGHENVSSDAISFIYAYDPLNRLIRADQGRLTVNTEHQASINPDDDDDGSWSKAIGWDLDILGNWSGPGGRWEATGDDLNGELLKRPDTHVVNEANEIIRRSGLSGVTFEYDDAGNLVYDGGFHYKYDAWNRLATVKEESGLNRIANYRYDALGRRINKKVYNSGPLDTVEKGDFFYYDGHRLIEHYRTIRVVTSDDGGGGPTPGKKPGVWHPMKVQKSDSGTRAPTGTTFKRVLDRSYVYGLNYIDEQVAQYTYDGEGKNGVLYHVLQDANYNVVGITDTDANLVHQYQYDPYGTPIGREHLSGPDLKNVFLHQGSYFALKDAQYIWKAREREVVKREE